MSDKDLAILFIIFTLNSHQLVRIAAEHTLKNKYKKNRTNGRAMRTTNACLHGSNSIK
jgi:hypothetical protein